MRPHEPPRVLHVLGSLNRGGIETWLLHVLRNTPPGLWSNEFLLHRTAPGAYEDEVRALGGVIHHCPGTHHPVHYSRQLRAHLRTQGPYDVVHSHVHFYSGVVLRAAHLERVPVRIAHSHTAPTGPGLRARPYQALMRRLILRHATRGLAAAPVAADSLFGVERTLPVETLHYGLDFTPFGRLSSRGAAKHELGLPRDRVVIGHVGRFVAQKNHAFIVATFSEMVRAGLNAHLLLVGSGPLEAAVRAQIGSLGMDDRCTFAGAHNDVLPFYGAMDMLLFPSLFEGLGLVGLEAQAAAVPVLASTGVPAEAAVVHGLLHRRELSEGPRAWARIALDIIADDPMLSRAVTAQVLDNSHYSVRHSIRELARIYRAHANAAIAGGVS